MNIRLLELFQIAGRKNYEFHYKIDENEKNKITINKEEKIITAVIGDPNCKSLPKLVNDIIEILE